jgi:hypothetical protein
LAGRYDRFFHAPHHDRSPETLGFGLRHPKELGKTGVRIPLDRADPNPVPPVGETGSPGFLVASPPNGYLEAEAVFRRTVTAETVVTFGRGSGDGPRVKPRGTGGERLLGTAPFRRLAQRV